MSHESEDEEFFKSSRFPERITHHGHMISTEKLIRMAMIGKVQQVPISMFNWLLDDRLFLDTVNKTSVEEADITKPIIWTIAKISVWDSSFDSSPGLDIPLLGLQRLIKASRTQNHINAIYISEEDLQSCLAY